MGRAEAMDLVGTLIAAFPQATIPDATAALYAEKLADVTPDVLAAAVNRLIETVKFFPAIGEIRTCAARLAGLLPATDAEALAIVRRADISRPVCRRDGSYAYTEREWAWPEDADPLTLELVRDTLARVGEPVDGAGKAHFGWETGFQKTYAVAAEAVTREALADLSRAQLTGGNAGLLGSAQGAR